MRQCSEKLEGNLVAGQSVVDYVNSVCHGRPPATPPFALSFSSVRQEFLWGEASSVLFPGNLAFMEQEPPTSKNDQ